MRHPAYHLRTNKAVDRLTLISQIRALLVKESKATFYSLSGPFLEDMKLVHLSFPSMRLVSIEASAQTFKRQQFHKFTSRLSLRNQSVEDFLLHEYEPSNQDVFWLDFTDLSLRSIQSFRLLLTKAPHLSLVRLTLRAQPNRSITEDITSLLTDHQVDALKAKIDDKFEKDFGAMLSHDSPRTPLCSNAEFARTVQLMIRRVASEALDNGSERDFLHLSSVRYDDGSQMLSVTGVVLERGKIEESVSRMRNEGLAVDMNEWPTPTEIEVPSLSAWERYSLDKHLPQKDTEALGAKLLTKLKYQIDSGEKRSAMALRQYARHYREYPNFVKANF